MLACRVGPFSFSFVTSCRLLERFEKADRPIDTEPEACTTAFAFALHRIEQYGLAAC